MLITYRPADGEPREWSFIPRDLTSLEAEDVEDATGWSFPVFQAQFYAGRTRARRAVLWILLRREQPELRFADVQYGMSELGFHWTGGTETTELAKQVEVDPDLDEETRARILADLAPAAAEPDAEDEESPKESGTGPAAAATSG